MDGNLVGIGVNQWPWGEGVGDSLPLSPPLSVVLYSLKNLLQLVLLGKKRGNNGILRGNQQSKYHTLQ